MIDPSRLRRLARFLIHAYIYWWRCLNVLGFNCAAFSFQTHGTLQEPSRAASLSVGTSVCCFTVQPCVTSYEAGAHRRLKLYSFIHCCSRLASQRNFQFSGLFHRFIAVSLTFAIEQDQLVQFLECCFQLNIVLLYGVDKIFVL